MYKGLYRIQKQNALGEVVFTTDWIENRITEFAFDRTMSSTGVAASYHDAKTNTVNTSGDTAGWWLDDRFTYGTRASLIGNSFIIASDEVKTELASEQPKLQTDPRFEVRFGNVIPGVLPYEWLTYDEVTNEFYIKLTQQFLPPTGTAFTVNTLALSISTNTSFGASYFTNGHNNTTKIADWNDYTANNIDLPILSYTAVSPAVVQELTETLIIDYKIVFEQPTGLTEITKPLWFAGMSALGHGYKNYSIARDFHMTYLRDGWLGGIKKPHELMGNASTTPLPTLGDEYNLWRRQYQDKQEFRSTGTTSFLDYFYKTHYARYTKELLDTDLGRIRGTMYGVGSYSNNRSFAHSWFDILPAGFNKAQNIYAHTPTKTGPFFDALDIAQTTGSVAVDASTFPDKRLPEYWRVNYATSGGVGSSTYNIARRIITGTNNNTFLYREEILDHPGYLNDSTNNSSEISNDTFGEVQTQWRAPLDGIHYRLGVNGSNEDMYATKEDVVLSDGRSAIFVLNHRRSYMYIFVPTEPEVLSIVDPVKFTDFPTAGKISGFSWDDLSGDLWITSHDKGITLVKDMLTVGVEPTVENMSFNTSFDAAILQSTTTVESATDSVDFGTNITVNRNYICVNSNPTGAGVCRVDIYDNDMNFLYTALDPAGGTVGSDSLFGQAMDLTTGDTHILAIGAPDDSGTVYLYDLNTKTPGNITPDSTIANPNSVANAAGDAFGTSVAMSISSGGTFLIASAPDEDSSAGITESSGMCYIFNIDDVSSPNWVGVIQNPDTSSNSAGDRFGFTVSISGDRAIIGSPYEAQGAASGAVYIFHSPTGGFSDPQLERSISNPSVTPTGNEFGKTLATSQNLLIVGAPETASDTHAAAGVVYVYDLISGNLLQTINSTHTADNIRFGSSISIDAGASRLAVSQSDATFIYKLSDYSVEEHLEIVSGSVGITSTFVAVGDPTGNTTGTVKLYTPGTAGSLTVGSNPDNIGYCVTTGSSVGGTNRVVWAIIEGALVKSTDRGVTWTGFDSTTAVAFDENNTLWYWGSTAALVANKLNDELAIVYNDSSSYSYNNNYSGNTSFNTYFSWWDEINGTQANRTSVNFGGYINYQNRTGLVISGGGNFWSNANNTLPASTTFDWSRKLMGCYDGNWYLSNYSPDSLKITTNDGVPRARPATLSYGSSTITAMVNPANVSNIGYNTSYVNQSGYTSLHNDDALNGWSSASYFGFAHGWSLNTPIGFTRKDGVKGIIRRNYVWDQSTSQFSDDIIFYPFDNATHPDEFVFKDNSFNFNSGADHQAYRFYSHAFGAVITTNQDGWWIESVGTPDKNLNVADDNYSRFLWDEYSWNGSDWVKVVDDTAISYKTTHSSSDATIDGVKVSFDDLSGTQTFVADEHHSTGIMHGIWNDNNEEWTFESDTTSIYPSATALGKTETLSLNETHAPISVTLRSLLNDGYGGNESSSATASDPLFSSAAYSDIGVVSTDTIVGGAIWLETNPTAYSTSYQNYVIAQVRHFMQPIGTLLSTYNYAQSQISGYRSNFKVGFRVADNLRGNSDCEVVYNICNQRGTYNRSFLYPDLKAGSSGEGSAWVKPSFGLSSHQYSGGLFPTELNHIDFGFRLERSSITGDDRSLVWNTPNIDIHIVENGVVVDTVSSGEYTLAYIQQDIDAYNQSSKEVLESVNNTDISADMAQHAIRGMAFSVKRIGTAVTYYINDVLVYTSLQTSTGSVGPATFVEITEQDYSVSGSNITNGIVLKDWKVKSEDFYVRVGTAGNGSFDSDLMILSTRNKPALNIKIDGVAATIVEDETLDSLAAGECSIFPREGYIRFSGNDATKSITIGDMSYLKKL